MQPISIWKPESKNGELVFIRPPLLPLGDHYADQIEIPGKKSEGTVRICYFGESAAAGYLYAPHVTPAKILQYQLNALTGNVNFDVVDLARTNERLEMMTETIEASFQLDPDILVIFTGNNWALLETPGVSPYGGNYKDRQLYAKQLTEDGFPGPVEYAAKKVLTKAAIAFERIRSIAEEKKIPVVLVVPEVNLADWENVQPVTWLPNGATGQWYQHFEQAKQQLKQKSWKALLKTALQMLELDEWSCPSSYRFLGKAHIELGNEIEAAEVFRAEIDATDYATMGFLAAPQAGPRIQEFLRKTAIRGNFEIVDLPKIFASHSGSVLPGRQFFLDYCHLTLEGMHLAMAGVAEKLISHSGNGNNKWEEIAKKTPIPDVLPNHNALAKFGAAIHNAHRLLTIEDKQDILEYWCKEALNDDIGITSAMHAISRIRLSETPATLTQAQQENLNSPYKLLTHHGLQYDYLDADLLEVIQKLTGEPLESSDFLNKNLVHPAYFLWEPLQQFYPNLMEEPGNKAYAYLKSPWPETGFCFFGQEKENTRISMVVRLPQNANRHSGKVLLDVNNMSLGAIEVSKKWASNVITVDRDLLKRGLNKLTLKWPELNSNGDKALKYIQQRLSSGLEVDVHPVFGEIFEIEIID